MAIDISLGQYMAGLVAFPVQQDNIAIGDTEDRVWYQRQQGNTDLFSTAGTLGLTTTVFDVEVMSLDIDLVQTTADAIKAALNGFQGVLSTDFVHLGMVEDVNDNYTPKNMGDDSGLHVVAFQVKLVTS